MDFNKSYTTLKQHEERLRRGEAPPLKGHTFRRVDYPIRRPPQSGFGDAEVLAIERLGAMRRLRGYLESGSEDRKESATRELRNILREDPTFAYAELLAARHSIWEAEANVLPSFGAAFESALATEDRGKLEKLAIRQPRLEALILVAQAVLGDIKAEQKVEFWLRAPAAADSEPAIIGLHSALRPLLRVIEGGRSIKDAIAETRETVINVLHDANEASLGEILLAA
jgi:hypothetical protein